MLRYIFIYGKFVLLLILFLGFNSCRKQKKTFRTDLVRHEEKPPVQPPKPVVTEYIVYVEASNSYAEQLRADVIYFDANEKEQKKSFIDKLDFNPLKAVLGDAFAGLRAQLFGANSSFGAIFKDLGVSPNNSNVQEQKKEQKKLLYKDTFFVTKQIKVGAHMESQQLEAEAGAEAENINSGKSKTQVDDSKVFLKVAILNKDGDTLKKQELKGRDAYGNKDKLKIITVTVP